MKKSIKFLPLLSMGLVVVGCQDYDAGFTESDIKAHQYTEDFKKEFGNIDPNQDWSMAANLTAKVNLEENVNGTLEIYTKAPGLQGCYLLAAAKVEDGQANIQFDAIKGSKLLYARIVKDGRNILASYFDVVDGNIIISTGKTRAAASGITLTEYNRRAWRMTDDAIEVVASLEKYPEDYNFWTNGTLNADLTDFTYNDAQLNPYDLVNTYVVNGNTRVTGAEYTYEQMKSVFGCTITKESGVFMEGEDHIEKYIADGTLLRDASLVVAEDGPVSMELIWRGTIYPNVFGYFFYPSDGSSLTVDYFWNTKKYVIIGGNSASAAENEVSSTNSITEYNNYQAGGTYDGWKPMGGNDAAPKMAMLPQSKMRGTKISLVNFDENGNASYDFKAGTRLGFFMYTTQNTKPQLVFSDCRLNYMLNYTSYKDGSHGKDVRPFAATFNYKGSTFLGFADGAGMDYDLNDLVFGAFNVVPSNEIGGDEPDPEAITWMVACEDLGGTFDYDFNDLVFGLRKKPNFDVSKSTVELIPYAAGGTLEAHVIYDGEDKGEIHKLVGGSSASTSTPLNVDDYQASVTPGAAVVLTSDIASATSINEIANNVMVKVETDAASNYYLTKSDYNGEKAPQMILFQAGWDWPSEGVDIRDLYPDFASWVAAESAHTDWYMSKDENFAYVTSPLAKPTTGGGSDSGNGGSDGGNGSGNTDTRTPMVVGETYTLNSNGEEATSISFKGTGYSWDAPANIVNCPTYKLPSDLSSSATGTLIVNTENAMNSNVDLCGSDFNYTVTLDRNYGTNGQALSASSTTISLTQMQALFSGTCFYVATGSGNKITSVTFKINE